MTSTSNFKKHKPKYSIIKYGKKFSDDELDEILSKIEKFDADGIRFIHLKDSVKKNFVKIKIAEFKLKYILVFLDENGLVQKFHLMINLDFMTLPFTVYLTKDVI